jgi:hypothetical protein
MYFAGLSRVVKGAHDKEIFWSPRVRGGGCTSGASQIDGEGKPATPAPIAAAWPSIRPMGGSVVVLLAAHCSGTRFIGNELTTRDSFG